MKTIIKGVYDMRKKKGIAWIVWAIIAGIIGVIVALLLCRSKKKR
jgi:hypothetical protein